MGDSIPQGSTARYRLQPLEFADLGLEKSQVVHRRLPLIAIAFPVSRQPSSRREQRPSTSEGDRARDVAGARSVLREWDSLEEPTAD